MTGSPQHPDDRANDRGTPRPGDAGQRRDRGLRLSRRLTRSLVGASAALVLGFSVLAATSTGSPGGTANPVTTTDTGQARTTTTTDTTTRGTTSTDATGASDGSAQDTSSAGSSSSGTSAPSSSSSTPAVTSGAS